MLFKSILVQWEPPPPETKNGDITGYKIKYKKSGRKKANTITTAANDRSLILKDLDRISTYQVVFKLFSTFYKHE